MHNADGGVGVFSIHKSLGAVMFLRLFGRRSNLAFLLQPPVSKTVMKSQVQLLLWRRFMFSHLLFSTMRL